jgi:general secretion pathway protein D
MQIFRLNRFKYIISILLVAVVCLESLYAKDCSSRVFNINISQQVSTYEILTQLSGECGYSIITQDSVAENKLHSSVYGININNMQLSSIFNLLISSKGLEYKFQDQVLKIKGLITRTFKVDYVNSERQGSSNTDISLSGDTGDSSSGDVGQAGGGELSSKTTGASIVSTDTFSFWNSIKVELGAVLNSPLDKFKAPAPIINKEAGLVTVSGTSSQIARVEAYLDSMMKRLHRQVMIDVKILSVNLDNSKTTGVDWAQLYKFQNIRAVYEGIYTDRVGEITDDAITAPGIGQTESNYIRLSGAVNIADVLKFLSTQGDVSSISNPKVVTMNNQPAIFSSGDQLYYKLQESSSQLSSGGSSEQQTDIVKSVFAGVLLDITPEISDNSEIILKINPSISSVKQAVQAEDGVRTLPPDLSKKQMSSVVKLRDGEKIILGGLINTKKGNNVQKVPVLGSIPIVGKVFRQDILTDTKEELVIIITPHIIKSSELFSLKQLGYKSNFNIE